MSKPLPAPATGTGLIAKVFDDAGDPVKGVVRFFELAAAALETSGFADGCPIATTALDTATSNREVRAACATVFMGWIDDVAARLAEIHAPKRARVLAVLALAALEGAIILSRKLQTTEPLNQAARQLEPALHG